ncbi:MAG TPA: glutathione S-transferase family protein [Alphaproteobacteria bacterium]|nr:glutathione S-transferase family protein [Alphaproteobacteria bacterium]
MKLYYAPTSPYVRMVRVAALEKGVDGQIELVDARAEGNDTEEKNPLNKVPAAVTDDGEVLIESRLICQYVDGLAGGPELYPSDPAARRRVLQQEALIHGVLDAAVLRRMETRREEGKQSPWWDERQKRKITLGLAQIERDLDAITGAPTIAPITLGCALAFMDRILPDTDWRADHPKLAAWFEAYAKTPHMQATAPAN